MDRVAVGTFYFDPEGKLESRYEVVAVDGDGNTALPLRRSRASPETVGEPTVHTVSVLRFAGAAETTRSACAAHHVLDCCRAFCIAPANRERTPRLDGRGDGILRPGTRIEKVSQREVRRGTAPRQTETPSPVLILVVLVTLSA